MLRRAGLLVVIVLAVACRRAPPPAVPDAGGEQLELTPPAELKDKVNETLEKEHQRTLDPKVE